jgi:hypothetical protein
MQKKRGSCSLLDGTETDADMAGSFVVILQDASWNFVTNGDALIDYLPILPGQTSPFDVLVRDNRYLAGETVPVRGLGAPSGR